MSSSAVGGSSSSSESQQPVIERISPRTLPGPLVAKNEGAIDWGWQSAFVAYGCSTHVVVVDTRYLKVYQTLSAGGKWPVVKVKWARETHYHDTDSPYALQLASADAAGRIVVWDVVSGHAKCTFNADDTKASPIIDMQWSDANLIVVLHSPNTLAVWNADNGTCVWKKHLQSGELHCFTIDPFAGANVCFLSQECILVLDDFSTTKKPLSSGRKFYISNHSAKPAPHSAEDGRRGLLRRRMRFLIRADPKSGPADASASLSDCLQIAYHRTRRHHLLLVFPREVLILDLAINQTVAIVTPDRNGSPFVQVFSCWQRDVLLCRHESGSITLRMRCGDPNGDTCPDVSYSLQCQSDALRLTRHTYVAGMAVCPVTESRVALVLSDGSFLVQELQYVAKGALKFVLTGTMSGVSSPPHVIRMCPHVTSRNWQVYDPLLAIGCINGAVQIFSAATGVLEKQMSVHTAPVRGIEWASLKSFLSYAYPNLGTSSGLVRNELMLTDVTTGHSTTFRTEREDESPIEMVRISYLRNYVIVAFKEDPFELWDLRNLSLLRVMPHNFPTVTALEWSPVHSRRQSSVGPETEESPSNDKEYFVFTDTDGQLYHFSVEGSRVRDISRIPPDAGMGSITCIAWKADQVVLGDVDGNLNLWDLKAKKSRGLQTHRGWIKKIRFSPGRGNLRVLVLYNDGVDLWDIKEVQLISHVKCPRDCPKVLDVDWASSDRPVMSTVDGCIHVVDISLRTSTSPLQDYQPVEHPWCPAELSPKTALNLKILLEHRVSIERPEDLLSLSKEEGVAADDLPKLQRQCSALEENLHAVLEASDVLQRCTHVARLFGDEEACHFWAVASHAFHPSEALEGNYELFCENATYRKLQLSRLALHESKRTSYAHTKKCADTLILLGETERAVQLLLETEPDNDNYYADCLKACLVTSVRSGSASQSVIKLVATNLIAGGHVQEGVELLCLIDKSLDACRYLQGAGRWEQAAWLAKSTLSAKECAEVMRRWVDHLQASGHRSKALLLALSTRDFPRVLGMLHSFGMVQRAALFLQACCENGSGHLDGHEALAEAVLTEYAHLLTSLGNYRCALHVCGQAGESVGELKERLLQLVSP